jgi:arylsulfatase A-like enzyme
MGLSLALSAPLGCSSDSEDPVPSPAPPTRPAAASPRNVILISLDTLRADHLGLYGYDRFTSPMLDAMAAQGVVFEDASTVAPWTLPSHASMLTGRSPKSHRVTSLKTKLPMGMPTLASMLAAKGFDTAAVVSSEWLKQEAYNVTKDFEHYQWVKTNPWRRNPSTWVTDQAMEWLREARQDSKRLFLFVHYYDLHTNYSSQPAYEKLFVTPYSGEADGSGRQMSRANWGVLTETCLEKPNLKLCEELEKQREGDTQERDEGETTIEAGPPIHFDADDLAHIQNLYDAGVRQLDTELGRFFALLRMEDFLDDTLLVITSDHGEEFMEHGHVEHFLSLHPQEVIRVLLLLRGPGVPKNVRISAPVSIVDIAPTILAQLDIDAPKPVEGMDLGPLWMARDDAERTKVQRRLQNRLLYMEAGGGLSFEEPFNEAIPLVVRAVRGGGFKLRYESKGETYKLFDLAADPGEQIDVSADHPMIAKRLRDAMERRYRDSTPVPSPEDRVEPDEADLERLRELGYVP